MIVKVMFCRVVDVCMIVVSVAGSYDHTVKVFDMRSGSSVMTMQHGHPVECVLLYPSEALLVSTGEQLVI